MRVFIIGASGLVGSNCMHYLSKKESFEVVGSHYSFATPDTEYFNVFEPASSTFDLDVFRPEIIIHSAALTHVDYCESHRDESYRNTVESTTAVLKLAEKYGALPIYISTDYVFDGKKGPYSEEDPVNPLSVYGKHKVQAEELIRAAGPKHLILRVTNVYGDEVRGKNFVSFLIREAQKNEEKILSLASDQYATPINAYDIARASYLLIRDKKYGLYHLSAGEYLSRTELAKKVLQHFPDSRAGIKAVSTKKLKQQAPRPLKGGLQNTKFLSEYPDFHFSTIDEYMRKSHGI